MLFESIGVLEDRGLPINLRWIRFLAARADEQKSMQRELLQIMRNLSGNICCAQCCATARKSTMPLHG